jgi:glycerol-3-phosphate acyltransferase PlsY
VPGPLILIYFAIAVGAYLLGSVPTGFLVAKAKGIDIRKVGSGNMGATNVFRVLGKPAGIIVLLIDGLKGFAAAAWLAPCIFNWLAPHFFKFDYQHPTGFFSAPFNEQAIDFQLRICVIAGICAVLGHNYTCWLHFKGGKGIATTAGVYFALAPLAVSIALATWIVTTLITRYVSVASIAAAIALPTAVWITKPDNLLLGIVTTALGLLAIFKHRKNIQRLMNGTEHRIGQKAQSAEAAK